MGTNTLYIDIELDQKKVIADLKKLEQELKKREKAINDKVKIKPTVDTKPAEKQLDDFDRDLIAEAKKLNENLTFKPTIDDKWVDEGLDDVRQSLSEFYDRIDSKDAKSYAERTANLKLYKKDLNALLKVARKTWNIKAIEELSSELELVWIKTTQAGAELRNFVKTWENNVSVLWKLFSNVNDEIEESRNELKKLWKTSHLDKLDKDLKDLNKSFKAWNITQEKYIRSLEKLNKKTQSSVWFTKGLKNAMWGLVWVMWGFIAFDKAKDYVLDMDKALTKLRITTWATKEEIKEYIESARNLQKVWFSDFDKNLNTLANVKRSLWLVWEEAEWVAKNILLISENFWESETEILKATNSLAKNMKLSFEDAWNYMLKALQKTNDPDLIDNIAEYSVNFEKMGYSAKDMFNIMVKGAENGAYKLDKVNDAIKEAEVSITDNSKSTRDAFKLMWLDYDAYLKKIASWEIQVKDVLEDVNIELLKLDAGLQDEAWTAIYRTKWEELSDEVLIWLTEIEDKIWDVNWTTEEAWKVLEESFWGAIAKTKGYIGWIVDSIREWGEENPKLAQTIWFVVIGLTALAVWLGAVWLVTTLLIPWLVALSTAIYAIPFIGWVSAIVSASIALYTLRDSIWGTGEKMTWWGAIIRWILLPLEILVLWIKDLIKGLWILINFFKSSKTVMRENAEQVVILKDKQKELNDQLKKWIITQDKYNKSSKKLWEEIKNLQTQEEILEDHTKKRKEEQEKARLETERSINAIDWYTDSTARLIKEKEDLTTKFKEGKISIEEYNEGLAQNKVWLENLDASHNKVISALWIIDNWQLSYIDKIKQINSLKLDSSAYDNLINKLRGVQNETLIALQLEAKLLKSKVVAANVIWSNLWWLGAISSSIGRAIAYSTELAKIQKQENEIIEIQKQGAKLIKVWSYGGWVATKTTPPVKKATWGGGGWKTQTQINIEDEKELQKQKDKTFKTELDWLKENWKYIAKNKDNEEDLLKTNENKRKILERLYELQNENIDDEEKVLEINKEIEDIKNDIAETTIEILNNQKKASQEYYDSVNKSIKKTEKSVEELSKSLDELNEKAKQLTWEKDTSLAERKLEIEKERKQILEDIAKLESNDRVWRTWSKVQDIDKELEGSMSESKRNRLLEKRKVLLEKINTQIQNTNRLNWETYEFAKKLKELESEEVYLDSNIEDTEALEEAKRQASRTTSEQITDEHIIKIAEVEEDILKTEEKLEAEKLKLEELNLLKSQAEIDLTNLIVIETDKRISEIERYKQSAIELAKTLRSLGFEGSISTARLWSVWEESSTPANITNNITNNNTISSNIDIKKMNRDTAKQVARTSASGNIY